MDDHTFEELLKSGEGKTVDYKVGRYFAQAKTKPKHLLNAEFVKDFVSFANTVRNTSAYILIGVGEKNNMGDPIGLIDNDALDTASYRQKLDSLTDQNIHFKFYPFFYKGKRFEVFEIPVVFYSRPITPVKTIGNSFVKGTVYVRNGDTNDVAKHEDHLKLEQWLKDLPKLHELNSKKNKKKHVSIFSEENIQKLFGHEAAEDERPERLKEYFFKNDVYDQVHVDLPLRILVGHKGIGKSALFRVSHQENLDSGNLSIWIKPDDVVDISEGETDFLKVIRAWKRGLYRIITKKVLFHFKIRGIDILDYEDVGDDLHEYILDLVFSEIKIDRLSKELKDFYNQFVINQEIHIYIDDLDRGWSGDKAGIQKISTLLNAVRDITNTNDKFKFRISLRSDVYFLVRTSDESTDKIEGSVVWYKWTYSQILAILVKRVNTYFDVQIPELVLKSSHQADLAKYLNEILNPYFNGEGKWSNVPTYKVLLSAIRKRPRDLVKLLTLAAKNARKRSSNVIETQDFKAIFEQYSRDRIQDTVNEFKSELRDVERLILGLKPSRNKSKSYRDKFYYTTSELMNKIEDIQERGAFYINGRQLSSREIAAFLYKINVITATKELATGVIDRKEFEENKYLVPKFEDFGYDWEVHMAYRWALAPNDREKMFYEF